MNALSILIILITEQGCIANVLFTVLLGDNHPCKPENLKVGFYIEVVLPQGRRQGGGLGGLKPPQFLADQLTLSQPGGAHYPHPVLQAPPDFQTLRWPCTA